jgi:hypothetical protein
MSYGTFKKIITCSLTLYFLIALCIPGPGREIYPFFAWDLFSIIPNPKERYDLYIISYGDKKYDDPINYFSGANLIFRQKSGYPTQFYNIIQNLGRAIETDNSREINKNKEKIESIFHPYSFKYEIRTGTYDPVEYWKSKRYLSEKKLGVFESQNDSNENP